MKPMPGYMAGPSAGTSSAAVGMINPIALLPGIRAPMQHFPMSGIAA